MESQNLSMNDVAEILDLTRQTIHGWVKEKFQTAYPKKFCWIYNKHW